MVAGSSPVGVFVKVTEDELIAKASVAESFSPAERDFAERMYFQYTEGQSWHETTGAEQRKWCELARLAHREAVRLLTGA